MKLIEPKVEYIPQGNTPEDIYKHIELCARTCYKSEDKITEDSAHKFVDRLIQSKHFAMLEHGTIYLYIKANIDNEACMFYEHNPYSRIVRKNFGEEDCYYITTNMRVLVENNRTTDIRYICSPTGHHIKRYTIKFICDRGVSHELVRHRVFSFAQESQRYCNYSKDKFNHEIVFIDPSWNMWQTAIYNGIDEFDGDYFNHALRDAEKYYFKLLDLGWTPQQARSVLPNATKTEIIMTGFEEDWKHFFDLRLRGTTGKPHPDMLAVAELANTELVTKCNINI